MRVTDRVSVKFRTYFSMNHLLAAYLFARQSASLEKGFSGNLNDCQEDTVQQRAYVTGCILSCASFLEAQINELFADAEDSSERLKELDKPTLELMAKLWRLQIPRTARYTILEKYQIALTLAGKTLMDTGKDPYQSVRMLIQLRNALVHYEPEWIQGFSDSPTQVSPHVFEKKLKGKFPDNPFTGAGNPYYPDKLLGHGCANWACESVLTFSDQFFSLLDIQTPYDHLRSSFKSV